MIELNVATDTAPDRRGVGVSLACCDPTRH